MINKLKNKTIIGLILVIFTLICVFQGRQLVNYRQEIGRLQKEIKTFERQNKITMQDLVKKNEELINAKKEADLLQEKIKVLFKNDSCVNTVIPDSFLSLLSKPTEF